jgi:hypothetical protein
MPMYAHAPRADLATSERLGACGLVLPSGAEVAATAAGTASIDR